uniref:Uncharacterized protein n=1 Tax=Gopherus evgoodei TaxID=1825980 RepID=A0A8C4Y767_9SAUR
IKAYGLVKGTRMTVLKTESRACQRTTTLAILGDLGQAAAYGKCVAAMTTGHIKMQKDVCMKEFEALKE